MNIESYRTVLLYTQLLCNGLLTTVCIWLASALLSALVGTVFGIISCQRLKCKTLQKIIAAYVYLFRGVPVYVQLLMVYFVLPDLCGIDIPAYAAAVCALGFCSGAYVTEIIRSGMNGVADGQWDACHVLGYDMPGALRWVILPQMVTHAFPALVNECESLLKSTALISAIGVLDVTKVASNIVARTMDPLPVYLVVACLYLSVSALLQIVSRVVARKVYV